MASLWRRPATADLSSFTCAEVDRALVAQSDEEPFYVRDIAGTLAEVGVPTPQMGIDLSMTELLGRGGRLCRASTGSAWPHVRFPCSSTPI